MTSPLPASGQRRVALGIEYDGSDFSGWQIQPKQSVRTVQAQLTRALSQVANHPVRLYCAGRTDAGVHACAQVIHFGTDSIRPEKAWVRGGNALLPPDISIRWAQDVEDDFHARFSATARRYHYLIDNRQERSALLRGRCTHHFTPLNAERMSEAAHALIGEHDFSAFRGAYCQSSTPMRHVMELNVTRQGHFILVDIKANAFLLHMVRNIVGALLPVGAGSQPPSWVAEVLAGRDRRLAGPTAAPDGLYLMQVDYPQQYNLPQSLNPSLPAVLPAGLVVG